MRYLITGLLLAGSLTLALADDWSEWRGPRKDGVLRTCPPLLETLPKDGPALAWAFDLPAPVGKTPYYSSPVACDGKVYFHLFTGTVQEGSDPKKPVIVDTADLLLCIDLATGQELWTARNAAPVSKNGAPNVPCIAGGKVYYVDNGGTARCLDAVTGAGVWAVPLGLKGALTSSCTVVDGKVVVADSALVALDAATGAVAWRNAGISKPAHGSPVGCTLGGKAYVLANGPEVSLVDVATGQAVWTVPGGINATVAVQDTVLVTAFYQKGISLYTMTPEAATLVKNVPMETNDNQATSPIIADGRAYLFDAKKSVCLDLATGETVWTGPGKGDVISSPILADGKLICNGKGQVQIINAADGKLLATGKVPFGGCTSLGMAGGKLLANTGTQVRCYNLAKP